MDLAERDLGLGIDRGVDLDGDAYQGEPEEPFPISPVGHDLYSRTHTASRQNGTSTLQI